MELNCCGMSLCASLWPDWSRERLQAHPGSVPHRLLHPWGRSQPRPLWRTPSSQYELLSQVGRTWCFNNHHLQPETWTKMRITRRIVQTLLFSPRLLVALGSGEGGGTQVLQGHFPAIFIFPGLTNFPTIVIAATKN